MISEPLPYKIVRGRYGQELCVHGWSPELEKLAIKEKISGLYVNSHEALPNNSVEFLRKLPWLQSLKIIDRHLLDIEAIQSLHGLRRLVLNTYSKTKIDYSVFPFLETLIPAHWNSKSPSLFLLPGLRNVGVSRLPAQAVPMLERLNNLEVLAVSSPRASSLDVLGGMQHLRKLSLSYFSQLTDNGFLAALPSLQDLSVYGSAGFSSLEPLRDSKSLRVLILDNVRKVDSLKPIAGLPLLERVGLGGNTSIVDGLTSVLLTLPTLKWANVGTGRHYDLKDKDLPKLPARTWLWDDEYYGEDYEW